jgi:Xaa-Pro aminopeptidase
VQRSDSPVGFVVTRDRAHFLCPADDADRIRQEELRGLGIDILPLAVLGAAALVERARDLASTQARWTCDVPGLPLEHHASIDELRRNLLPEELDRLRKLGREASAALEEVATECYRGILERDAAARLAAECIRRQLQPRLVLAGADERLDNYARPLPKGTSAEHTLVLALVAAHGGLHVALSRTICLARPPVLLLERFEELVELSAQLRHEARPGTILGHVVQRVLRPGVPTTLGGPIGYALFEEEARPDSTWKLAAGQPLAWSLALPGARCEDTCLVSDTSSELVTATENWPRRCVQIGATTHEIPDLLLL